MSLFRVYVDGALSYSWQDLQRVRILGGNFERDRDVSHDEGVRCGEGKEPRGREAERILSRQQTSSVEDCSSYDAAAGPAAGGRQ